MIIESRQDEWRFKMSSSQPVPDEDLQQRLADSVDVSAAMDNCFFHSYAAYRLSHHLDLPADLFRPVPGRDSPAERLKTQFTQASDLDLFNQHYRQMNQHASSDEEMLMEKTLVLGVLLREWFADKLLENAANKEELFDNNDEHKPSFMKMMVICQDASLGDPNERLELLRLQNDPIFKANEAYFSQVAHQPEGAVSEMALREYWNQSGYQNYCAYLAKPGVSISITDVAPVLNAENLPYTIYSKSSAQTMLENHGEPGMPRFECALDAASGHYHLLKTDQTAESLGQYQASMSQYLVDREEVLKLPDEQRLSACRHMPSQLLATIFRPGQVPAEASELLQESVRAMKASVQSHSLAGRPTVPTDSGQLSAREAHVLDSMVNEVVDPAKVQHYKDELKQLLIQGREGFSNRPTMDADEQLAQELQDEEFKKAGLKPGGHS
jgi:hypothetical protein